MFVVWGIVKAVATVAVIWGFLIFMFPGDETNYD